MFKKILKLLLNRFPNWAYGLECQVCAMSFADAYSHELHVDSVKGLKTKHKGKVPILALEDDR